ncbi:hypothetical protein F0562_014709 [Nyssa sinensis]|uniref:Uncharacterized protein n=1 Tax=Nyssa sinensis TaxID=561372 RepID=A0A5J4ZNJ1_9ASTE|nr:hypothetical protein F0562_014709 [Nyssa sinensis]
MMRESSAHSGEKSLKFHELNWVLDQHSSPVRREGANRSSFAMKTLSNDEIDLEGGKLEKDRGKIVRSGRL